MKLIKIGFGLLLICGALYVVLGEQLSGASANAFINARLTTIRAPIAGKIELISRPLGAQVAQGDPLGSLEDPLVDGIRLLDLELQQADAQTEIKGSKPSSRLSMNRLMSCRPARPSIVRKENASSRLRLSLPTPRVLRPRHV